MSVRAEIWTSETDSCALLFKYYAHHSSGVVTLEMTTDKILPHFLLFLITWVYLHFSGGWLVREPESAARPSYLLPLLSVPRCVWCLGVWGHVGCHLPQSFISFIALGSNCKKLFGCINFFYFFLVCFLPQLIIVSSICWALPNGQVCSLFIASVLSNHSSFR